MFYILGRTNRFLVLSPSVYNYGMNYLFMTTRYCIMNGQEALAIKHPQDQFNQMLCMIHDDG